MGRGRRRRGRRRGSRRRGDPAGKHGCAVPGFVDVQVNGFAGVSFTVRDRAGSTGRPRRSQRTASRRSSRRFRRRGPTSIRPRSSWRLGRSPTRRPAPGRSASTSRDRSSQRRGAAPNGPSGSGAGRVARERPVEQGAGDGDDPCPRAGGARQSSIDSPRPRRSGCPSRPSTTSDRPPSSRSSGTRRCIGRTDE